MSESKFGGLLSGLKKMVFTEEYIDSTTQPVVSNNNSDKPANTSFTPIPNEKVAVSTSQPSNIGIVTTNVASNEMVDKIHSLLESMNKPGVDFFELWNAAEAMGGANTTNLQNAFTTLKVLGLDKQTVLTTGQNYVAELQEKLGADINRKTAEKDSLNNKLSTEKLNLQNNKKQLEQSIAEMQTKLSETNNQLNAIDNNYQTELSSIDAKIKVGTNALNTVVNQINTVLQTVQTSIN